MPWNEGSALGSVIGAAAAYHGIKERKKKEDLANKTTALQQTLLEQQIAAGKPLTSLPWQTAPGASPTATGASPSGTTGVAAATGAAAAAPPPSSSPGGVKTLGHVVAHAARNVAVPPVSTTYPDQANLDLAEQNYFGSLKYITDPRIAQLVPAYKDAWISSLAAKRDWATQQAERIKEQDLNNYRQQEIGLMSKRDAETAHRDNMAHLDRLAAIQKDIENNIRTTSTSVTTTGMRDTTSTSNRAAQDTAAMQRVRAQQTGATGRVNITQNATTARANAANAALGSTGAPAPATTPPPGGQKVGMADATAEAKKQGVPLQQYLDYLQSQGWTVTP